MANIDTGEIRSWALLSDEERKSGKWVALPEKDENGQPVRARRVNVGESFLRHMFPDPTEQADILKDFERVRGNFDATGKPR